MDDETLRVTLDARLGNLLVAADGVVTDGPGVQERTDGSQVGVLIVRDLDLRGARGALCHVGSAEEAEGAIQDDRVRNLGNLRPKLLGIDIAGLDGVGMHVLALREGIAECITSAIGDRKGGSIGLGEPVAGLGRIGCMHGCKSSRHVGSIEPFCGRQDSTEINRTEMTQLVSRKRVGDGQEIANLQI